MCLPPTTARSDTVQPEPQFTEHFLVFLTLTDGLDNEQRARFADLLEALGVWRDTAVEKAVQQALAQLTPAGPR